MSFSADWCLLLHNIFDVKECSVQEIFNLDVSILRIPDVNIYIIQHKLGDSTKSHHHHPPLPSPGRAAQNTFLYCRLQDYGLVYIYISHWYTEYTADTLNSRLHRWQKVASILPTGWHYTRYCYGSRITRTSYGKIRLEISISTRILLHRCSAGLFPIRGNNWSNLYDSRRL